MMQNKITTGELLQKAVNQHRAGKMRQAGEIYRYILDVYPDHADANHLLGLIEYQLDNYQGAEQLIRRAIKKNPRNSSYYNNLSIVCKEQGRMQEAVTFCRKAIAIKHDNFEAHVNLGNYLKDLGQLWKAVASYKKAIVLKNDNAEVYNNLGAVLSDLGHLAEAAASCRRALSIKPYFSQACNSLGRVLLLQGHLAEAVASFRKALALDPLLIAARSNLLYAMNFDETISQAEIYMESLSQAAKILEIIQTQAESLYNNIPAPERRLRVGYVSSDFRSHSVAYFFEPVIKAHNRKNVEVFCYAEVTKPDATTARLQAAADHWSAISGSSNAEVAAMIREDAIDILVDLGGHTAQNRLVVFAIKPAPVQITWLGYPNTTGLKSIDYRLTDVVAEPGDGADRLHSEELIRLPQGIHCYKPDAAAPDVGLLPCRECGHITFGSFNNLTKVRPHVVKAWAGIMHAVPGSHLLLKARQLGDDETRKRLIEMFKAEGIPTGTIHLHARLDNKTEHLDLYNRVDIGLDPFPYNGTTTTCEALWMGVPVVTLLGDRHAGRIGASILHRVGLEELVAASVDEYVQIARKLAADRQRLQAMRFGLRRQMQESDLMDSRLFTESLENAYREMWIRWLKERI